MILPTAGAALCLLATAAPATTAAPDTLPPAIQSMLDDAIATGKPEEIAAVFKFAARAAPDSAEAINARLAQWKAEQAQAKAEAEAAKKRELAEASLLEKWKGEGQIGAFRNTGNTNSVGLAAGLKLNRDGLRWRFKFGARVDYQRTNGRTNKEQWIVSLEPNYRFNERLFAFGLAQYEHDRFQGFDARYSLAGGIGYQVIDNAKVKLSLKAGPAVRRTDFTTGLSDTMAAALGSGNFAWKISPNVKLNEDADLYVQSGNSTFTSITALDSKIWKSLSARLSYSIEHETDPPFNREKTDTISRFTLVYSF